MKTLVKTIVSIALSFGLVFLYTMSIGQEGTIVDGVSDNASFWFYVLAMVLIAFLIYQLVIERFFRKKK